MTGSGLCRLSLALGMSLVGAAHDRTISERTARKLAQEALVALGQPTAQIEPWKYYWAPEFYGFMGYWPGPIADDGTGVLQTYYLSVNPWTGDVWDAMACSRVVSPAIQKEQESIWKRSRLPADAREALQDKSPASCSLIELMTGEKKH